MKLRATLSVLITLLVTARFEMCFAYPRVQEERDKQTFFFSYMPDSFLISSDGLVEVLLKWNIGGINTSSKNRLLVVPYASFGNVRIYNSLTSEFVGMADNYSKRPYLSENMIIRFDGIENAKTPIDLLFTITDTYSGKVYKTRSQKLYPIQFFYSYIKLLNDSLTVIRD